MFGDKKMVLKIYGLIWAVGILAVGLTYFTGYFNLFTAIVFGFLSFGAIYMGLISVLPLVFEPHPHSKH
jgi:hypothetical protein